MGSARVENHEKGGRDAWQDPSHAVAFDYLASLPLPLLCKTLDGMNEMRLLARRLEEKRGLSLLEVGCATGAVAAYVARRYPTWSYRGVDVSEVAVRRARERHGDDRFSVTDGTLAELGTQRYDVVLSRDVALHQSDPFAFIATLLERAEVAIALRLRTRDVGATVLDVRQSCQFHYGRYWVPYIVINIDELIEFLREKERVRRVVVARSHEVLGGFNGRYLPRELYSREAGGAQTALYVELGDRAEAGADVTLEDRADGARYNALDRLALRMWNRIGRVRRVATHARS